MQLGQANAGICVRQPGAGPLRPVRLHTEIHVWKTSGNNQRKRKLRRSLRHQRRSQQRVDGADPRLRGCCEYMLLLLLLFLLLLMMMMMIAFV